MATHDPDHNGSDADVIVVGTGMGGGAAGYTLAKAGYKVLFLERGLSGDRFDPSLSGNYTEHFFKNRTAPERRELLSRSGRCTYRLNGKIPVLGGGQGGSSAVYGGGLLRFHPTDFQSWPFSYRDILKYYNECDRLFEPRGTQDPLGDRRVLAEPAELSATGRELFQYLTGQNLNPYRTPIAYKRTEDCLECFGSFCANRCKQHAGNVLVRNAIERHSARAAYEVTVESLVMNGKRCMGVQCATPKGQALFKANHIFLAAGALITPTILMQSKSEAHPNGVGNRSALVGRFLMRHLIDFFYIKTRAKDYVGRRLTEISVSDYYRNAKEGWGIINIVGGIMSPELISESFAEQHFSRLPILGQWIKPFVKHGLTFLTKERVLLATIMEDEASPENRVLPDSTTENVKINYRISSRDKNRLRLFRRELRAKLKGLSPNLIKVANENMMISHACGTCRMGTDPARSVVNPNGKIHGTDNVYVADASLFPSSGAANPSLTVAACGMKIADEFRG